LAEIVALLERFYPPPLAEPWDAVGLVVGQPEARVTRIAWAVDPVRRAVEEAIDWDADLLVVHHPLLLRPVNSVAATDYKGAIVHRLITAGCALYTAHTNADAAAGGVAEELARAIGVVVSGPLVPAVGGGEGEGLGRIGRLEAPLTLGSFASRVARALPSTEHGVRIAGDLDAMVQTVAVLGGAGDSLFDQVRAAGVDVYVTADLRHHPASEARERAEFDGGGRPYLLDVSHSASEWHWLERAARRVTKAAAEHGARVDTNVIAWVADPWTSKIV
jgi:dinuclear metal center YbgI/SA1388 family protein